ncbi:predicted protein [Sclerotinia sclerotiorum 1980 UF-70]|uniref:Uncharacterized protein n=1 Tax=Sclerotinia sclerotiorum (strain ATCC 18683 / 1980 / Ss-1) TaxID=665079 RepID=A7EKM4_SCLS1|nr:predicted protein [Sclerotinia sclerotiorum 1980 UF-70]EDO03390.1 predicted protein [Sclerotinia sclerotiorum 1980 UF-70]
MILDERDKTRQDTLSISGDLESVHMLQGSYRQFGNRVSVALLGAVVDRSLLILSLPLLGVSDVQRVKLGSGWAEFGFWYIGIETKLGKIRLTDSYSFWGEVIQVKLQVPRKFKNLPSCFAAADEPPLATLGVNVSPDRLIYEHLISDQHLTTDRKILGYGKTTAPLLRLSSGTWTSYLKMQWLNAQSLLHIDDSNEGCVQTVECTPFPPENHNEICCLLTATFI